MAGGADQVPGGALRTGIRLTGGGRLKRECRTSGRGVSGPSTRAGSCGARDVEIAAVRKAGPSRCASSRADRRTTASAATAVPKTPPAQWR